MSDLNIINTNFQRDQLAKFLPTHELIRAFEAMVRQTTETAPETYTLLAAAVLELQLQTPQRSTNLNDIYTQLNEIKTFIGMT